MTAATAELAEREQQIAAEVAALKSRLDANDLSHAERKVILKQIKSLDVEGLEVWEAEGGH